ncbi:transmembrane protein [Pelomyxa schiedti]|nr:transmembrane protein [Pelomyxa schiedti]
MLRRKRKLRLRKHRAGGSGSGGEGAAPVEESYAPVMFNDPEANSQVGFPSNLIRTTKYTLLTFLPKNLFEQYRRATNLYFLLVVIITCIPQISPMSPVTSILPTAFVLLVTMLKEGYEDFRRYQADKIVNSQTFDIVKGPEEEDIHKTKSSEIKTGDILKLYKEDRVPADMLLLNTSRVDGVCHVETSQLDGETNLKPFQSLGFSTGKTQKELVEIKGKVTSEIPDPSLYTYRARIEFPDGQKISINQKNLLLQGAKVRNTDWVYGIVVYAGIHTKLSLNQRNPPSKVSSSERVLNRFVLGVFIFKMCCVVLSSTLAGVWERESSGAWYLLGPDNETFPKTTALKNFFTYFALLSYLIPMSLMVTFEVAKLIQGMFMEWDNEMKLESLENGKLQMVGMNCKTTNLNDELAMVKYIFSDKTGTLTENKMEFSKCSIDGIIYDKPMDGELERVLSSPKYDPHANGATFNPVEEFLLNLALCHTAVPERNKNDEIEYQAQSPDEVALCLAACANNFVFSEQRGKDMIVNIKGVPASFQVLGVMEFTSARRRMSILLRTSRGNVRMYCKGADSVMMDLLEDTPENAKRKAKVDKDLLYFSGLGLRTLVIAYKDVPEEIYRDWQSKYNEASNELNNREKLVEKVNDEIEKGFKLIGCTAIEDKLQQGVPEAIHFLLEAGLYVWVITGDKQDTAINIGLSCKLITPTTRLAKINCETAEACQETLTKEIEIMKPGEDVGLVIDGPTLTHALALHSALFMRLASFCHSIICCRVTPLQKAQVVACVRRYTSAITLSIGDGANDVSMIQTAHIGVGIFGREGTQAARASDYAIRQFRHLTRLVTVHGRYSLVRNAILIKYSFYKNMAYFLVQFWFAFFNRFSGMTFYDDFFITFFNIFFTFLVPLFIACLEKDINEAVIKKYPQSYSSLQRNNIFGLPRLFAWLFFAFLHSLFFFFSGYLYFFVNDVVDVGGYTNHVWLHSLYVSLAAIITIQLMVVIYVKTWTGWLLVSVLLSLLAVVVDFILESFIPNFSPSNKIYWGIPIVMSQPGFYLYTLIVCFIAIVPFVIARYCHRQFFPEAWMILQEKFSTNKIDFMDEGTEMGPLGTSASTSVSFVSTPSTTSVNIQEDPLDKGKDKSDD